jgi:hypothetical protein
MAELQKIDYEKISVKCTEKDKDYIPTNWYVPARKAWQIVAWCLIQMRNGAVIRSNNNCDKMIHRFWEYIEEYAIAFGSETDEN